ISTSSIRTVLALIFVKVGSSLSFRCIFALGCWLEFPGVCPVSGADGRYPAGGIDGISGQLALPCPLTPRPVKAAAFQFFAGFSRGDFVKKDLQAVQFRV